MSPVAAGLLLGAVVTSASAALVGLRMVLIHREKAFVSKPLVEMQRKLDDLESRLTSLVMRR